MNQLTPEMIEGKPGFEKIYRIPAVYYTSWLEKHGGMFSGKRVLDFGCGEGLTTVGLSLFCGAAEVVGVEIGEDFQHCSALLQAVDETLQIPPNVQFKKVAPAHSLGHEEFDVIVSWSVLEHVSQHIFDQQLQALYDALKPGGFCVFQVAPLYHTSFGSHLFGVHAPWEHLTEQINLLEERVYQYCQDKAVADNMWECFLTLNKFTKQDFLSRINAAGLPIQEVYETYVSDEPTPYLLEIFTREVLTKEQILMVCKKQ